MAQQLVTDDNGNLVIDVRGPRFGAAITTLVLATALVVQGPIGVGLVTWQFVAFGISTVAGLAWSPYGRLFRLVKRRFQLGAPTETEPEGPPRFAQACGLAVTAVALVAFALGASTVAWIAVGVVLVLSVLLASTGLCIGCELYLLGHRVLRAGQSRDDQGRDGQDSDGQVRVGQVRDRQGRDARGGDGRGRSVATTREAG